MLLNTGLRKYFWGEAVSRDCYLVNWSPASAINFKTPEEVWSGNPPHYSNLRGFGCPAYLHIDQDKLEQRSASSLVTLLESRDIDYGHLIQNLPSL